MTPGVDLSVAQIVESPWYSNKTVVQMVFIGNLTKIDLRLAIFYMRMKNNEPLGQLIIFSFELGQTISESALNLLTSQLNTTRLQVRRSDVEAVLGDKMRDGMGGKLPHMQNEQLLS